MIHDLLIQRATDLERSPALLTAYRYGDHLLPRIGLVQVLHLSSGKVHGPLVRSRADELWVLISGSCLFLAKDKRSGSPTMGEGQRHEAAIPTRLLLPFGVELTIESQEDATLLRLATHGENQPGEVGPPLWEQP